VLRPKRRRNLPADGSSRSTGIGLNLPPSIHSGARPLVPMEPLFSPKALTLRSGSRVKAGAASFDFFWARNAIFHGLRALGIQPGQKVLVPAYVCAAAIEPIEHFGAKVSFYAIRRNCAPDWADLESKIQCDVRAILAVHYFGFPCDVARFRTLCDRYNLYLVEDCAHVLEGVPSPHRFGELGDFSVFSHRKYLPLFDGGTLRLNRVSPDFRVRLQFETPLFTLRVAKNLFDRRKPPTAPLHAERSHASQPVEGRTQRALDIVHGLPQKPFYVTPDSTSFLPWMANVPMSRLSKHLVSHFPLEEIAFKRRANYSYLLERVSELEGVQPLFGPLPPGVVPWVLPLTIGDRREMDLELRALGIPAVTWVSVRDPRISTQEFPVADMLYESLVLLPIHQDLGQPQLDLIAEAVTSVCRTGQGAKRHPSGNLGL
jgi:dTDP-4-amino-4,6-dideoxygalactose transaminase